MPTEYLNKNGSRPPGTKLPFALRGTTHVEPVTSIPSPSQLLECHHGLQSAFGVRRHFSAATASSNDAHQLGSRATCSTRSPGYRWAAVAPTHSTNGASVAGSGVNFGLALACRGSQSPTPTPCGRAPPTLSVLASVSIIPHLVVLPSRTARSLACVPRPGDVAVLLQRVSHFRPPLH